MFTMRKLAAAIVVFAFAFSVSTTSQASVTTTKPIPAVDLSATPAGGCPSPAAMRRYRYRHPGPFTTQAGSIVGLSAMVSTWGQRPRQRQAALSGRVLEPRRYTSVTSTVCLPNMQVRSRSTSTVLLST